jgi:N6-L-threonylcarbamoyladenine synthase/protein kinase Bud32
MLVLGIEGTAWAASAAVHDTATGETTVFTEAYEPDTGGIHPREAAEHMREHVPEVVARARSHAAEHAASGTEADAAEHAASGTEAGAIDVVAFSRGPGLGPCLRIVATAARALAGRLDVALVGVNHMLAHLEIGRHGSGFDSPVCLNASGANAHLLAFHNGRYRVLGETMDTGVGNALDKFARHVGWSHPGGPKIEAAAREGEYVDLPYVVKGMDFSFSGLSSAAKEAVDDGVPVEDVCRGLEETVFGMLTEVSERALSLTGSDELVLGGGVGQNGRLQRMLADMCEARGGDFYAPEPRFLRDNAGMIAVLGAKMAAAGDTLAIEDSSVRPDFRPDEVPVTWREESESRANRPDAGGENRGAEATVAPALAPVFAGDLRKERAAKSYRHPSLDDRLRTERTRLEARLLHEARGLGVSTPVLRDVDVRERALVLEAVGDADLHAAPTAARVRTVARHLAVLHGAGVVHGDPTTRNVRVRTGDGPDGTPEAADADDEGSDGGTGEPGTGTARTWLIDFGLGYHSGTAEDHAMDLHVFEQSLSGTVADPESLRTAFEDAYREAGDASVLDQLREIEGRGRYQ